MKTLISHRIKSLQSYLKDNDLGAVIIPSTDPHLSEYIAPYWKCREFISGFNGSAGMVVVTQQSAGLWTDSRYFLQAESQLEGTSIELFREMLPDTPTIFDYLGEKLDKEGSVAIDSALFSMIQVEQLEKDLYMIGLNLKHISDPFLTLWEDRPSLPTDPAFIYDICYAGERSIEKVAQIQSLLQSKNIDSLFVSSLDEIAWILNIRGTDIHCNPVVISYLLITQTQTVWFVAPSKLDPKIKAYLKEEGIVVEEYNNVFKYLNTCTEKSMLIDPSKNSYAIFDAVNIDCDITLKQSPISLLKAIRNEKEIECLHAAMTKDGVAMVKFLKWLESRIGTHEESELSIDKHLHDFRAEQPLYKGESFDTIAGYKEHGAIVHYSATEESNAKLQPKGFLLLDSGAQYLDGTTDITRTIALGELTEEEKKDYTLVLKGHINLAMAKFPAGTRGAQLDVLAHLPLWQNGMNYLHGTGHGVGHFLSVHEGPQSIRMNENPVVLYPGMVTSNEPGVYKTGSHGIRIENLILTCKDQAGMYGDYLKFETLTLCPICKKGIIKGMLNDEEINWFNTYHQKVYNTLSPLLNKEEKEWLKEATSNI